jgi:hypothetical protein
MLKPKVLALDPMTYTNEQMDLIKQGLMPADQDDRWYCNWDGTKLLWARSWTGYVTFEVVITFKDGLWHRGECLVESDQERYHASDEESAQTLDVLINELLLHIYTHRRTRH